MLKQGLAYTALGAITLLLIALGVWGWHIETPQWPQVYQLIWGPALEETDRYILLELRLPRIVLAALAGAALATAGLVLQGLFRNPLVDPFVIGVSGGGALGAGLALSLNWTFSFWGLSPVPFFAFVTALGVMALVYRMGQVRGHLYIDRLLLAGVAMSALCSAILSLVLVLKGDGLDAVVYWIMGSFAGRTWQEVGLFLPFFVGGLLLLASQLQALNTLQLGEESAHYLGINVNRVKNQVLVASTLLAAGVVSVSGVVGFVGLVVPHMTRFLLRASDFRLLFFPNLLLGAGLLVLADGTARNLLNYQEIPVGILTAILGAPFFIGLLLKMRA